MNADGFTRYVILLSHVPGTNLSRELVRAHVVHLEKLEEKGQLVLCGPFSDYKGGMIIIKAASYDEAKQIAESDPFVKSNAETYELRTLKLSCKENNHIGMGSD
ncbi:hypothetical protein KKG05_04415 [bacterium]|nr:hypothetical protein [bacterium]